jgi:cytochrome P450 family 13
VFSIHQNEELWGPDALEFVPERWLQEDSSKLMANFYGFGSGPRFVFWCKFGEAFKTNFRQCVGMKLAFMEDKLALVRLLQTYRLHAIPETEVFFGAFREVNNNQI